MTNDSVKLAQLWVDLQKMKIKLDNEILPASSYLGLDDTELMDSMEELSKKMNDHFEKFKLVAVVSNANRGSIHS